MTAGIPFFATAEGPVLGLGVSLPEPVEESFRDEWLRNKSLTEDGAGLLLYNCREGGEPENHFTAYYEDAEIVGAALGVLPSVTHSGAKQVIISQARTHSAASRGWL